MSDKKDITEKQFKAVVQRVFFGKPIAGKSPKKTRGKRDRLIGSAPTDGKK